jgi:hypothetical protein
MMRLAAVALLWAGTAWAAPQAPAVTVTGLVDHSGPVVLDGLKQVDVSAKFHTVHGDQAHTWRGPLLLDVVNAAGVKDAPGKRTHMQHSILARGADGYAAVIAIGELEAGGEGKQVIVAVREDGTPMAVPRLIVPGDASFTRGVHDLSALDVR